jgi:predicted AAA+ superfamily ATPase
LKISHMIPRHLPAWSSNLSKRLVKSPKVLLADTGLLAHLAGLHRERLEEEPRLLGPLLENFVLMEIRKQSTWSRTQPALFHFRTQTGQEIDLLLEDAAGRVAGVEIKAAATVQERDVRALRDLAETLGKRFVRGVVLYTGETVVPFSDRIVAVPLPALWRYPAAGTVGGRQILGDDPPRVGDDPPGAGDGPS